MATHPAVTLQYKDGGQHQRTQRYPRHHQQDDQLDLRKDGGAALAHRHPQQPVTVLTAVATAGGQVGRGSTSRTPPRSGPQWCLTSGASEAGRTHAAEAYGTVKAAASVQARAAGAVV